jgi:hypothetical protein
MYHILHKASAERCTPMGYTYFQIQTFLYGPELVKDTNQITLEKTEQACKAATGVNAYIMN